MKFPTLQRRISSYLAPSLTSCGDAGQNSGVLFLSSQTHLVRLVLSVLQVELRSCFRWALSYLMHMNFIFFFSTSKLKSQTLRASCVATVCCPKTYKCPWLLLIRVLTFAVCVTSFLRHILVILPWSLLGFTSYQSRMQPWLRFAPLKHVEIIFPIKRAKRSN